MEAIREFRGKYRFLSNFYGDSPEHIQFTVVYDGMVFKSTEHAYMAAKTTDMVIRRHIQSMERCAQTKRFWNGREDEYRDDWYEIRVEIMLDLLRQKFAHPELRQMLLDTGDAELLEGNNWGDVFWGVDQDTGEGQNWLGRLLMQVREEIRLETNR